MNFLAVEIVTKPLIIFVGTNMPLGSLVVAKNSVPNTIFGVCPWKIVDGELVNRTPEEMAEFETEWLAAQKINSQTIAVEKLKSSVDAKFTYAGKSFPMNEGARLYYQAMEKTTGKASYNVIAVDGGIVELLVANKADFLQAYYDKLLELTEPEEVL